MNQQPLPNRFQKLAAGRRLLIVAILGVALLIVLVVIAGLTYQFGRVRGLADALATVTAQPRLLGLVAPTFTPTAELAPTSTPHRHLLADAFGHANRYPGDCCRVGRLLFCVCWRAWQPWPLSISCRAAGALLPCLCPEYGAYGCW